MTSPPDAHVQQVARDARPRVARCALLVLFLCTACGAPGRLPPAPEPEPVREVQKTQHPGGATRSERELLVHADGRSERDGYEKEFAPDGRLLVERYFVHDVPSGTWREWYKDGTPRAEVEWGTPGVGQALPSRYWHANGRLAAEGRARAGVRAGEWSYFDEEGALLRRGPYEAGLRHGPWVFFRADGTKEAEGRYERGQRVGTWLLWDEHGVAHERTAAEARPRD